MPTGVKARHILIASSENVIHCKQDKNCTFVVPAWEIREVNGIKRKYSGYFFLKRHIETAHGEKVRKRRRSGGENRSRAY